MSRAERSLDPRYFQDLYAADPDPWRFATSDYERAKYAATLAALPRAHYPRALEVGCSIGVLTRSLARRCGALLAVDVAPQALLEAEGRCAGEPHVHFAEMRVPDAWPDGAFDLILLSEVVYYLDRPDVRRLAFKVRGSLDAGGDVVLVHWTGLTDYPLSGDEAVEAFIAAWPDDLRRHASARHEAYRLDLLSRD